MINMSIFLIIAVCGASLAFGYIQAKRMNKQQRLPSRAIYYGSYFSLTNLFMLCGIVLIYSLSVDWVLDTLFLSKITSQTGFEGLAPEQILHEVKATVLLNQSLSGTDYQHLTDYYQNLVTFSNIGLFLLIVTFSSALTYYNYKRLSPSFKARAKIEKMARRFFFYCSIIAIFVTIGIVFSLVLEALRFLHQVPLHKFLFGLHWSPQTAIGPDGETLTSSFGVLPVMVGTLLIAVIALLIAGPIGLMSAIYLAEYAPKRVREVVKPLLEILAGIPTVVYGFFASLTVAPFLKDAGEFFDLKVSSESALAAGLVMGIMIIPFISSLADDIITAVPKSLRDGGLGLGSTKSETIKKIVLPAALPGIMSGYLLAFSRAIGETMIVVMAAGMTANLTINPLNSVTTVTVQIAALMVGDQEFDSAKTLSAFGLGLLLFIVTLIFNIFALIIVRKYQEKYD